MLAQQYRLKKKSDIQTLFTKGESLVGSLLFCKYKLNNLPTSRATFTFSKKLKLKAVQKNRFKRQLRHAYFNTVIKTGILNLSYDFVFILYKMPKEDKNSFQQFQDNFNTIILNLTKNV